MINLGNYEISNYALVKEQLEQAVEAAMLQLEAKGNFRDHSGQDRKLARAVAYQVLYPLQARGTQGLCNCC